VTASDLEARPDRSPPPARRWSDRRLPWIALGLVVVVALAVGAGDRGGPPDAHQRISALEASVRCPSCEDLSVADSSAPAAVQLRALISSDVGAGQSDTQIRQFLVDRYGPSILLQPPTSGAIGLVWLLPLVAIAVALAALGAFFWRRGRSRPAPAPVSEADRRAVEEALAARADEGSRR
jgi:cytochrome c-type biogenesis protein CcmH